MELIVFSLLLVHLHSKYSSSDPQILIKLLWSWIILCWPDSMGCCTRLGTAVMGNAPCSRQPSDGWASKGWSPPCEMGIQVRFMLVLNLPQVRYSSSWAGQEGTHGWQLDSEIEVMVLSFGFPSSQVRPLLNLLKLGGGVVSAPSAVQNKALSVFFCAPKSCGWYFGGRDHAKTISISWILNVAFDAFKWASNLLSWNEKFCRIDGKGHCTVKRLHKQLCTWMRF